MGGIIFGSLVGLVVMLCVTHYVANQFYLAACEKGWDEGKYYWLSFFFGIVGWLLVIALPDRRAPKPVVMTPAKDTYSSDLPPL